MNAMRAVRIAAVALSVGTCGSAQDQQWLRDDFNDPGKLPLAVPTNPRVEAKVADGLLLLADRGSIQGDMVTCQKAWCADPEAGAACQARVKVQRCDGLAGVMIGFSDGVHEDILTLYEDRIELYRAGLKHMMDTADDFHEYRIDIRGTDVSVTVDTTPAIKGIGVFTFPAHQGRNRLSIGGGASVSQGEAFWDWLTWTDGLGAARRIHPVVAGAEQIVVFKQKGVYAPFPSLCRHPDTRFLYATFTKKTRATHHETTDSTRCTMESRDGGRTWNEVDTLPAGATGPRPAEIFQTGDGALVRIGQNWRRWFPPERKHEFEGKYRVTTPGTYKPGWFAVNSGGFAARSEDAGKTWTRTAIPGLDTFVSCSSPWSYTQLQDGRVIRAFMVRSDDGESGDVCAVTTRDGRSAEVANVMGDPEETLQFTEETLVHETSGGAIWMLTRVGAGDDHLWQGVSHDGGRTWTARKTGVKGHPPSGMVKLADGRMVLTYGYRHPPYGIRAVVSCDEGLTWDTDNVIVLRNDGAGYDLGYPTSMLLEDGTVLTMYYFVTDDDHITHVACTRWRVPETGK